MNGVHRSQWSRWCLAVAFVSVLVLVGVLGRPWREPMLEGRPVRKLVRQARSADSEAAAVFRRNGSKSVPGLVSIMGSGPSVSARVADQLKKNTWIWGRLPVRLQRWVYQTQGEAQDREFDREWAVACCGLLNENAVTAHAALLRACKDRNWRVRAEAVKSLLRTEVPPEKALPALIDRMLHDNYSEVRSSAAFYIGLLGEKAEPALRALRQATNDQGLWVASNARQALEKVQTAVAQRHERHDTAGSAPAAR